MGVGSRIRSAHLPGKGIPLPVCGKAVVHGPPAPTARPSPVRRPGGDRAAFVAFLCVVLASALIFSAAPSGARAEDRQSLPVLLVNGAIYPRTFRTSDLPPAFRADPPRGGADALYIMQFSGPVREDWLEEIKGLGASPRGYLAHDALVVSMDASAYSRVEGLGFVSWSGLYQPYYKISPALQLRLVQGGKVTALAQVYDPAKLESVLETLRAMPLEIIAWGGDRWCGMAVLRLPVEEIKEVAALPEVEWLDLYGRGSIPCAAEHAAGVSAVEGAAGESWRRGPRTASPTGSRETVAVADADWGYPSDEPLPSWLAGRVAGRVSMGGEDRRWHDHGLATTLALLLGDALGERQPEVRPLQVILYATGYGLGVPQMPVSVYGLLEDAYSRGARVFLSGSVPEGRESLTRYGTFSFLRDAFAWSRPDMLLVEPAGNEGTDVDGDGRVDPGSLLGGSCAKNAVSVGACEGPTGGSVPAYRELDGAFPGVFSNPPLGEDACAGHPRGMAAFSSRGPTDDGRIKPDLVAPGTGIPVLPPAGGEEKVLAGWSDGAVLRACGTSLAAAFLAGQAAVLRGAVLLSTGRDPSAALLKALLVNGAEDLHPGQYGSEKPEVPPAPNPVEGWGRADPSRTERLSWMRMVDDREGLRTGDVRVFRVTVDSVRELRVTLAWTDYPSLPQSRMRLVNDLDLRVIGPGGESYYPNGRRSRDPLNNVERVVVDVGGRPGKYTVEVSAWNVPLAPQPYALVVQGR